MGCRLCNVIYLQKQEYKETETAILVGIRILIGSVCLCSLRNRDIDVMLYHTVFYELIYLEICNRGLHYLCSALAKGATPDVRILSNQLDLKTGYYYSLFFSLICHTSF